MKELFLICALSLPASIGQPMLMDKAKAELVRKVKDFVERYAPGSKVILVPHGKLPLRKDLEKLPMGINGKDIYIKRQSAIQESA